MSDDAAEATLEPNVKRSRRTMELALTLLPDSDERLRGALASDDAERVRSEAHRFKGSCLSIGATRIALRCHELEKEPTSMEMRAAFLRELSGELEALRAALQAALQALPPGAK